SDPPCERRYPYLDRSLLEFMYAVPREQLVRPGQRRSLMRRSLADIVPDELLNRRRKAYVVRTPIASACSQWENLMETATGMVSDRLAIVDSQRCFDALQESQRGQEVSVVL